MCSQCVDFSSGILKKIVPKLQPGANVRELCEFGDGLLAEETFKVFKKEKEMKKGINDGFGANDFSNSYIVAVVLLVFLQFTTKKF